MDSPLVTARIAPTAWSLEGQGGSLRPRPRYCQAGLIPTIGPAPGLEGGLCGVELRLLAGLAAVGKKAPALEVTMVRPGIISRNIVIE